MINTDSFLPTAILNREAGGKKEGGFSREDTKKVACRPANKERRTPPSGLAKSNEKSRCEADKLAWQARDTIIKTEDSAIAWPAAREYLMGCINNRCLILYCTAALRRHAHIHKASHTRGNYLRQK